MYADSMPLDNTFHETTPHGPAGFPIQFYIDELYKFREQRVPLHWHSEPEFFVVSSGDTTIQIGIHPLTVHDGQGIFINSNVLHGFAQVNPGDRCMCPNIVFDTGLIAPVGSAIHRKYIKPIILGAAHPYLLLDSQNPWQKALLDKLNTIFALLHTFAPQGAYGSLPDFNYHLAGLSPLCYEMQVQVCLNQVWQELYLHRNDFPEVVYGKKDLQSQVRLQKMISFIKENFTQPVTLANIAQAANISKTEASRCFRTFLACSPVDYLINIRIENAERELLNPTLSISEISRRCGFHSVSYFIKIIKRKTGLTPGQIRPG